MRTTILLVDDHPVFREGLRALIDKSGTSQVIAEAGNGLDAVRLAGELKPDLVIMDLTMPIMNGIDATREITNSHPEIKVLVLSMESDRFFVVESLKAGAMGYLLKDAAFAELADAIDTVVNGETYLPRKVSTLVVKEFLQCIPEDIAPVYQSLTPREREILQLIADGKCIKEIASLLDVSNKTVENQRHAVMQKLQLFSVAELTKFAVRHGLSSLTK
ncbi:MAG: response regulator transcription factor [Geobacteraceae bacterium]|nr:response regulator transcription factor [Geobacteraceae bacterium]NTW81311.1 response regulator transcription factor [Geobacteraceae bacterium]